MQFANYLEYYELLCRRLDYYPPQVRLTADLEFWQSIRMGICRLPWVMGFMQRRNKSPPPKEKWAQGGRVCTKVHRRGYMREQVELKGGTLEITWCRRQRRDFVKRFPVDPREQYISKVRVARGIYRILTIVSISHAWKKNKEFCRVETYL